MLITRDVTQLLEILLRTSVVYVTLLALLRLAGKRELGQLNLFDLVVILIIANAVQNAMVGADTSLNGGLLAALWLVLLNWSVGRLAARSQRLGHAFIGHPTMLIYDGRTMPQNLQREGISVDDLDMAVREHGFESPQQIRLAVLETDGTISVIGMDSALRRTRRRVRGRKQAG